MALRLGGALKELRIHLCQTSEASKGVRDWIQNNYVNVKKANPSFPILIRECNGIQPRVWARYEDRPLTKIIAAKCESDSQMKGSVAAEKGVETSSSLTNLSAGDVTSAIQKLVK